MQRRPALTHQVQALQRLDRAHEDRGRAARRLGDDVEAVVHPVDKVHVGMAGRPEHRPVAGGRPEARVRCPVVDADVCLDLDDPPGPEARLVVADESRAEQASGGLERGAGEERSVDDGSGYGPVTICSMLSGTNRPNSVKKIGRIDSRKKAVTCAASIQSQKSRRKCSSLPLSGMPGMRKNESRMMMTIDEQQHGLEHAQQAADHLVDEARLLEQRLRLVEALDRDGQGDEGGKEDRPEPDHVGVLVGELRPVLREERAERVAEVRREQEREHQRPEPEQAPDRALREAEHEEAEQDQEEDEIEPGQAADERAEIH